MSEESSLTFGEDKSLGKNNEVLDIIAGKKNIEEVDFDDPKVVDNHISQLEKAHKMIDKNMLNYYTKLINGKVLKHKTKENFKYYKALSNIIRKDYISYPIMRNFVVRKLSMKYAASFRNIIVQNAESRLLGNPDYAQKLDNKITAYKFADKIGLRRPKTDPKTYRFSEIEPQEGPIVIKPTTATGSMGVYLIFNKNKILSVREGKYLSSWSKLVNDVEKKIKQDETRARKYFNKDEWMIEELITGPGGPESPAPDLKFHTFYGEVMMVLEVKRDNGHWYYYYDADMNPVNTGSDGADLEYKFATGFNKKDLDKIIAVSLEIPVPYIRIDMHKGKDELVFDEFTYYPGGFHSYNDEWDRKFGEAYVNAEARLKKDLLKGKKFKGFCETFKI